MKAEDDMMGGTQTGHVAFINKRLRTALACFLAAESFLLPSFAIAELADTSVSTYCRMGGQVDQWHHYDIPAGYSLICGLADNNASAWGGVTTTLTGSFEVIDHTIVAADVGDVRASAIVSASQGSDAYADAWGIVSYWFSFHEIKPLPQPPPLKVPIFLTVYGEGTLDLEGTLGANISAAAEGSVSLRHLRNPVAWFYYSVLPPEVQDSFAEVALLDLYTPDIHNVSLMARCALSAHSTYDQGGYHNGSGQCSAGVDPSFAFDQATFDQRMGDKTFLLDEYYRFEFSENIEFLQPNGVAEPATVALMILGFAGLFTTARRRTTH